MGLGHGQGRLPCPRSKEAATFSATSPPLDARHCNQPSMASLQSFAMRNFTTRFAGILISAPVAGLRPMRALRFTRTRLPSPGTLNPSLAPLHGSMRYGPTNRRTAVRAAVSYAPFGQ